MTSEGDAVRDWRALSIVVIALVVLIFVANLHLEVRGEVEDVGIFSRFIHSVILSFIMVNGALFLITLALSHKHAKIVEQALGTLFASVAGALLFGIIIDAGLTLNGAPSDVWSQFAVTAIRLMVADLAILLAFGISFGVLLTLVTGRKNPADPLLDLNSTSFEVEEE
ncbi:MAG: hypothetical protein HOE69_01965 [Euryarchaeota archaeon]|jgi:hypothetical protein|nr:hypothetical protein [Euryarchaeota archaeon]